MLLSGFDRQSLALTSKQTVPQTIITYITYGITFNRGHHSFLVCILVLLPLTHHSLLDAFLFATDVTVHRLPTDNRHLPVRPSI